MEPRLCRFFSDKDERMNSNSSSRATAALPYFYIDVLLRTSTDPQLTLSFEGLEITGAYNNLADVSSGGVVKATNKVGFPLPQLQVVFHDCYVHDNFAKVCNCV